MYFVLRTIGNPPSAIVNVAAAELQVSENASQALVGWRHLLNAFKLEFKTAFNVLKH